MRVKDLIDILSDKDRFDENSIVTFSINDDYHDLLLDSIAGIPGSISIDSNTIECPPRNITRFYFVAPLTRLEINNMIEANYQPTVFGDHRKLKLMSCKDEKSYINC